MKQPTPTPNPLEKLGDTPMVKRFLVYAFLDAAGISRKVFDKLVRSGKVQAFRPGGPKSHAYYLREEVVAQFGAPWMGNSNPTQ